MTFLPSSGAVSVCTERIESEALLPRKYSKTLEEHMSEKELLTREDCLAEIAAIDGATPAKISAQAIGGGHASCSNGLHLSAHPEFYPCSENIRSRLPTG